MGKYDDLIKQRQQKSAGNKYSDILGQMKQRQGTALNVSLDQSANIDTGKVVELNNLSRKSKIPKSLLEIAPDDFKKKFEKQTFDSLKVSEESPGLARFAQNPENMALAKSNLPNLVKMSKQSGKLTTNKTSFAKDLANAGKSGFHQTGSSLLMAAVGSGLLDVQDAKDLIAEANRRSVELNQTTAEYAREFDQEISKDIKDIERNKDRFFEGIDEVGEGEILAGLGKATKGAGMTVVETLDLIGSAVNGKDRIKGLVRASAQSAANSLPAIMGSIGGGVAGAKVGGAAGAAAGSVVPGVGTATVGAAGATGGGLVGAATGAFAGSLPIEFGASLAEQLGSKYDLTDPEQVAAAFADPAEIERITAGAKRKAITTASLDALLSVFFAGKFAKAAAGKGFIRQAAAKAGDVGTEVVTETVSEFGGQVAREQSLRDASLGDSIFEGVTSLGRSISDATVFGAARTAGAAKDAVTEQVEKRKEFKQALDPIVAVKKMDKDIQVATESIANSQAMAEVLSIAKEDPQLLKAEGKIEEIITNSTSEDASAFFQLDDWDDFWLSRDEDPQAKATEISDSVGEAYADAKRTGADLELPLGATIEKMAREVGEVDDVVKIMRTKVDGLNIVDAIATLQDLPSQISEAAKEAESQQKNPLSRIRKERVEQYKSAGLKDVDARVQAKIDTFRYNQRSAITGKDPLTLFKEDNVKVNRFDGVKQADADTQTVGNDEFFQTVDPDQSLKDDQGFLVKENEKTQVVAKFPKQIRVVPVKKLARQSQLAKTPEKLKRSILNKHREIIGKPVIKNQHTGRNFKIDESLLIQAVDSSIDKFQKAGRRDAKRARLVFGLELSAINNLDQVMEGAVYTHQKDTNEHVFYSPISDGKNFGYMKLTVGTLKKVNTVQSIEFVTQEVTPAAATEADATSGPAVSPPDVLSLSSFTDGVNEARKTFSRFFQDGKQGPKGRIRINDFEINIDLFKNANRSTLLHETGHLWLEQSRRDFVAVSKKRKKTPAQEQFIQDMNVLLEHLGVSKFEDIKRDQHELFARSIEAYFMEGKAPTQELRSVFAKFKVWLTSVYRQLKNLGAPLKDDVRAVFDRMLVSNEEVTDANDSETMFDDAVAAGMSKADAERYTKAREDVQRVAEERMMNDLIQEWEKDAKREGRKQYREEAEAFVEEERVYKALEFMKNGRLADGSQARINREQAVEFYGQDVVDLMPQRFVLKKGAGVHPSVMAELLGYADANAMANELIVAPSKKERVDQLVEQRVREDNPLLFNDPEALEDMAQDYIHNEKKADLLKLEMDLLYNNKLGDFKKIARTAVRRPPSKSAVKLEAQRIIAKKKRKEIRPYLFLNAEKKAAKDAAKAFADGDLNAVLDFKRKELINHELYREALNAEKSFQKYDKKFRLINKDTKTLPKNREISLVNAARAILVDYGLSNQEGRVTDHLSALKAYDPDAHQAVMDLVESISVPSKLASEMTFDEMTEVHNTVDTIWNLSREAKVMEIDGQRVDRAIIRDQLIEQLNNSNLKKREYGKEEKLQGWKETEYSLLGFKAGLTRVESWVSFMDKLSPEGLFRKFIFQPVSEAADRFRSDNNLYMKRFKELLETVEFEAKEIDANELSYKFKDKGELLGALLHTGNESNLRKLLLGREWGTVDEGGGLITTQWDNFIDRMHNEGVLTRKDWEFIQNTWDMFEELKPAAQKAHKKLYGHFFDEITAKPIETPFGTFKGGYAPAVTDPVLVVERQSQEEKEIFEKQANSFMFPSTGRGFTKKRIDQYTQPLVMDLRLAARHFDKALRFIHLQPAVTDVAKLIGDKNFKDELHKFDPKLVNGMLMPWLQRAALQQVETPSTDPTWKFIERMAKKIRTNTGLQIMVGNVTNTIQQFTGFSIAAVKVKPKHIRHAMVAYLRDREKITGIVNEKSVFMRERSGSQIFDSKRRIDELLINPSKYERAVEFARQNGYILQEVSQGIVDRITWWAAYNETIEQGKTEEQSVRRANSVVRETQGSFSPEDMSKFEAGTAFQRLFTMFYSYFNMQANLLGTEFTTVIREDGLREGAGRLLYVYAMGFLMPAFLSELMVRGMGGEFDEDDDDKYVDDMLEAFFFSQARTASAFFPIIGQVGSAGINTLNDKWYDDRISTTPAVSMLEGAVRTPKSVYQAMFEKGSKKKATRDALTFIGLVTGAPVLPLARPIGYMQGVSEGQIKKPKNAPDAIRGLITGKGERK